MTRKSEIIEQAVLLLKQAHDGLRFTVLIKSIQAVLPHIPKNTIVGTIWNLETQIPDIVYKPAKGLFRLVEYKEVNRITETLLSSQRVREQDFYISFADYIVSDLEECTKAIPLGGNIFRDRWGTPDVIGIRKAKSSDIIKMQTEVVSAELKLDENNLVTAFGQACAYKLFSHKSYLVIPKTSSEEDISRIEALCLIFGIGLITFNSSNVGNPSFEIRNRATKQDPDLFYANKILKIVENKLFN